MYTITFYTYFYNFFCPLVGSYLVFSTYYALSFRKLHILKTFFWQEVEQLPQILQPWALTSSYRSIFFYILPSLCEVLISHHMNVICIFLSLKVYIWYFYVCGNSLYQPIYLPTYRRFPFFFLFVGLVMGDGHWVRETTDRRLLRTEITKHMKLQICKFYIKVTCIVFEYCLQDACRTTRLICISSDLLPTNAAARM